MYYVGIDLGTSACKLLLVDEGGAVRSEVTKEYPVLSPSGLERAEPGGLVAGCDGRGARTAPRF